MRAIQALHRLLPERFREGLRDVADATFVERARRCTVRASTGVVDNEYARGRWDYLGGIGEMTRYAIIAGYCKYGGSSSVLDLGCGAGVLRRWLGPPDTIDYVGVELSSVAVEAAEGAWTDARTSFVAADVASYVPDRKFDIIVFNEVLYYFERPDEILSRFASVLKTDGKIIVSLWSSPESRRVWQRSQGSVRVVDEVQVKHQSGVSWQIRFCEPRVSAA